MKLSSLNCISLHHDCRRCKQYSAILGRLVCPVSTCAKCVEYRTDCSGKDLWERTGPKTNNQNLLWFYTVFSKTFNLFIIIIYKGYSFLYKNITAQITLVTYTRRQDIHCYMYSYTHPPPPPVVFLKISCLCLPPGT